MAETKPTKVAEWASGAGRTLEPAAGEKTTGWQVDDRPPARKMNWLQYIAYTWFNWLNERMFDGASAEDLEVTGVDIATGVDQEGGDLRLSGGSSTGDGGSEIQFQLAKANQGAGAVVRTPATVAEFDDTGLFTTEGVEATAAITNGTGLKGTGNGTGAGSHGVGVNGYGVIAESDTTSPAKSALRTVPQDTLPSVAPAAGDCCPLSPGKLQMYDGTGWGKMVTQVLATITDSTTLDNVAAGTLDQKYTIPANTLRAGDTIRMRAAISIGFVAAPTFTVNPRLGGNNMGTMPVAIGGTTDYFMLDTIMVVRSIGAVATIMAYTHMYVIDVTGAVGVSHGDVIIWAAADTTAAMDVEIHMQFAPQAVGNTATLKSLIVDIQ